MIRGLNAESNGCIGTLGKKKNGTFQVKLEKRTMGVKKENLVLLMGNMQGDHTEAQHDVPLLCVCCLEKPPSYVMTNCGHACCCDDCLTMMMNHERRTQVGGQADVTMVCCPLCRKRTACVPVVEFHGKIFFP